MVRDTFQGRFVLTTASAIGIHVAACTSRARTQVTRRTSGIDREMPWFASPMILDVAAALGRIVPAWSPPPPPSPPPLLYLSFKYAGFADGPRGCLTSGPFFVLAASESFSSVSQRRRRAAQQYRAETAPLSSSSASLSTHRVSKG